MIARDLLNKRSMRPAFMLVLSALSQSACGTAVVDGDCADGYEECDGRCVRAGSCGTSSDSSFVDDGSSTDARSDTVTDGSPRTDSGARDGTFADADGETDAASSGDSSDVSALDSSSDTSLASDGSGLDVTDGGVFDPDSAATDASDESSSDGTSDSLVSDALDLDGSGEGGAAGDGGDDSGGSCGVGETYCGKCVDLDIDPENCGACGVFCPTGLCNGGKCRGARAGHMVAIGHDFVSVSPTAAVAKVASNAIFLSASNPVRVLEYTEFADLTAVTSVRKIVGAAATTSGRSWTRVVAPTSDDVKTSLNIDDFDLLLVYDQPTAPLGTLSSIGTDLRAKLTSFCQSGGIVVVLDGGTGRAEMPDLLTMSGMLGVGGQLGSSGKALEVIVPSDAVGIAVLSPYLAPTNSVTFTLTEAPSSTVVVVIDEPKSTRPVVVHKVVFKP